MRNSRVQLVATAVALSLTACGEVASEKTGRETKPATATLPDDTSTPIDMSDTTTVPTIPPPSNGSNVVDASVPDAAPQLPIMTADGCFKSLKGNVPGPQYDQFGPKMGTHCAGTQQQKIQGIQKLVFLGDSITAGTPPNGPTQIYRSIVTEGIKKRFGQNVEVGDCSKWGARDWDLLGKPQTTQVGEIQQCFPSGVENKKTLVVMTMGGNDIASWANSQLPAAQAMIEADTASAQLGAALAWLKDPAHFPNGSDVIFSNVYEFTDTSGDLHACPSSGLAGLKPNYAQGTSAIVYFQEQYMKQAVATGTDMLFLLENFCGHGYKKDDPTLQCYRGPNTDLWFDLTCIHPNPIGHSKIAEYVLTVVDGG